MSHASNDTSYRPKPSNSPGLSTSGFRREADTSIELIALPDRIDSGPARERHVLGVDVQMMSACAPKRQERSMNTKSSNDPDMAISGSASTQRELKIAMEPPLAGSATRGADPAVQQQPKNVMDRILNYDLTKSDNSEYQQALSASIRTDTGAPSHSTKAFAATTQQQSLDYGNSTVWQVNSANLQNSRIDVDRAATNTLTKLIDSTKQQESLRKMGDLCVTENGQPKNPMILQRPTANLRRTYVVGSSKPEPLLSKWSSSFKMYRAAANGSDNDPITGKPRDLVTQNIPPHNGSAENLEKPTTPQQTIAYVDPFTCDNFPGTNIVRSRTSSKQQRNIIAATSEAMEKDVRSTGPLWHTPSSASMTKTSSSSSLGRPMPNVAKLQGDTTFNLQSENKHDMPKSAPAKAVNAPAQRTSNLQQYPPQDRSRDSHRDLPQGLSRMDGSVKPADIADHPGLNTTVSQATGLKPVSSENEFRKREANNSPGRLRDSSLSKPVVRRSPPKLAIATPFGVPDEANPHVYKPTVLKLSRPSMRKEGQVHRQEASSTISVRKGYQDSGREAAVQPCIQNESFETRREDANAIGQPDRKADLEASHADLAKKDLPGRLPVPTTQKRRPTPSQTQTLERQKRPIDPAEKTRSPDKTVGHLYIASQNGGSEDPLSRSLVEKSREEHKDYEQELSSTTKRLSDPNEYEKSQLDHNQVSEVDMFDGRSEIVPSQTAKGTVTQGKSGSADPALRPSATPNVISDITSRESNEEAKGTPLSLESFQSKLDQCLADLREDHRYYVKVVHHRTS